MQVCVCSCVVDLEFVPPGGVVSGLKQTCSRVYVEKSIHDVVHYADLVWRSSGLQVF